MPSLSQLLCTLQGMNEEQAKKLLTEMLPHFTLGSILHLLADLHDSNEVVQNSLIVVGIGIDSVQATGES